MDKFQASEVINGTFGECWINGDKFAEVTKLQAKVALKKTAVPMCGDLTDGQKLTGIDRKGSLKMHKVSSRLQSKIADAIQDGIMPEFTIVSKLADPTALGQERVALYGVTFDEISVVDWEAKKLGDATLNFTYQRHKYLDKIDA